MREPIGRLLRLSHPCSYYCRDGVHAVTLLATPDCTREFMLAILADDPTFAGHVVDIRPAPEADVAQWRDHPTERFDAQGYLGLRPKAPEAHRVPWLALISEEPLSC